MVIIINKQLNSTDKNYHREKNYYISINYLNPITQYKKFIIVDINKRHTLKATLEGINKNVFRTQTNIQDGTIRKNNNNNKKNSIPLHFHKKISKTDVNMGS